MPRNANARATRSKGFDVFVVWFFRLRSLTRTLLPTLSPARAPRQPPRRRSSRLRALILMPLVRLLTLRAGDVARRPMRPGDSTCKGPMASKLVTWSVSWEIPVRDPTVPVYMPSGAVILKFPPGEEVQGGRFRSERGERAENYASEVNEHAQTFDDSFPIIVAPRVALSAATVVFMLGLSSCVCGHPRSIGARKMNLHRKHIDMGCSF